MSDFFDPEYEDDVPEGGRFEPEPPEDRGPLFIDACRKHLDEIRGHRHEVYVKTTVLFELLMSRRRDKMLLVDHRLALQRAAAFCHRLGPGGGMCDEWTNVLNAAFDADKYDSTAWLHRGYRTALLAHITAALMLSQCLSETDVIACSTDSEPYISSWLRTSFGLGSSDIPF